MACTYGENTAMKVGMNLLLWTAAVQEEHFGLFDDIKSWGFDGVELPMFAPDCSDWKAIAAKLGDAGLESTAVVVPPGDASLISEEKLIRQRGIDHLKASVDACVAVGASAMAGPIYHPVGALIGRGPSEDEIQRCIDSLKEVAAHAEAANVLVALEPLNRFETFVCNSQAQARRISDAVGSTHFGHMYDTFHANIEEKDLAEAVKTGGDKIVHVHISANDRATPGEDHVDYETTLRALKGIGYDSWLTIEAFGSRLPELAGATCIWRKMAPSEEHVAKNGCKFVRDLWSRV